MNSSQYQAALHTFGMTLSVIVAQPPGAGRRCRLPHYVLNAAWYKRSQASKKMIRKKYPGENQAGEGQRIANKIDKRAEVRNSCAAGIVKNQDEHFYRLPSLNL